MWGFHLISDICPVDKYLKLGKMLNINNACWCHTLVNRVIVIGSGNKPNHNLNAWL